MKRTLLIALTILCVTALAAGAQSYKLEFYASDTSPGCALASGGVGMSQVHVVLTGTGGVMALLFGAQIPACWNATWVGDNLARPTIYPGGNDIPGDVWLGIGDTQQDLGLSIAFTTCTDLPLYIGTVDFLGASPAPCCPLAVTHPSAWSNFSTLAQVVDCSFIAHEAAGGSILVSSGPTCACEHQPLATEQSTWGRVKALYR